MTQPVIVTPALGAGSTPAGSSPAGSGSPATTVQPPPRVYLPDLLTGQSQTGRYIDPASGQYKLDANGDFVGMSTAQQLVQIAICDINFAASIETVDPSTPAKMLDLITTALAPSSEIVQVVRLNAAQFGVNGEGASLVWRDLTEGPNARERVTPLGGG